MLNKIRALLSLYRQFGLGWLLFRLGYTLRMRLGILGWQMPVYEWDDRPLAYWLKPDVPSEPAEYVRWREAHAPRFLFDGIPSLPRDIPWDSQIVVNEAEQILSGELCYFKHTPYQIGFPPDWQIDPMSRVRINTQKHWSQIPDYGAYDIKYIWEASRFNQVYAFVRAYAHRPDERYAEAFWVLVEDWARNNPPERGPNWKCGQEASLRLLAWCFGLYGFKHSPSTTPQRIARLTQLTGALAERIYLNIDYAISTRGNHAVSEAFGLWLTGLLFPELKNSRKYSSLGRSLLEHEAEIHIFQDGTYSMYSLNYQRFILHVYFLAMRLGELNQSRFSISLYRAVASSLDFLYQLIEPSSGNMPVYGSNDGALVLPLNTCDFADYRPTLQAGWFLTRGKLLFEAGAWDEDLFWLCGASALSSELEVTPEPSSHSFADGGVYTLRSPRSFALIRCTEFCERPSHADQLHVDLWWHGQNIACDAGTYLYNGQGIWQNGLAHTAAHNTVVVDSEDQMIWYSRFTWGEWARGRVIQNTSFEGMQIWQGEHEGYTRLKDPVRHQRTVLMLDEEHWLVVDHLLGKQPHHYSLHWLFHDFPHSVTLEQNLICLWPESTRFQIRMGLLDGKSVFSTVRGDQQSTRGWRSRYYGHKEPALSARLETNQSQACFWTFFGFAGDSAELVEQTLNLQAGNHSFRVQLPNPIIPGGVIQSLGH